jgi:hypothetical protein
MQPHAHEHGVNNNKRKSERGRAVWGFGNKRTRKSTPMVGAALSSGNHCRSQKRTKRLLFPTAELPMRITLTLTNSGGGGRSNSGME